MEENVQKSVEDKTKKKELKYNSLVTIFSFLFTVVAIVLVVIMVNFIYESLLLNKTKNAILDLGQEDNLFISVIRNNYGDAVNFAVNSNFKKNYYIKGNKIRIDNYNINNGGIEVLKNKAYETIGENRFIVDENNKTYANMLLQVTDNNFESVIKNIFHFENLSKANNGKINLDISLLLKDKYLGKNECNLISLANTFGGEIIDGSTVRSNILLTNKSTNLPVKLMIQTNIKEKFTYEYITFLVQKGIVKDQDVEMPDLVDYTKVDKL